MSTVKISELAAITTINANTSNTLLMGVDIPTGITGKFTAHTLAQGLYLNEILNVGNNSIVFPNTIAQFSGNSNTYLQMNMQNFTSNGSGDFIITADTGTNANSYIDLGINNSTYSDAAYNAMAPYDGYLYVHGPSDTGAAGNLVVGTASTNANVSIIVGGTTSENVVAKLTKNGLILNKPITFADGTSQNTSIGTSAATYANGAFTQANAAFLIANTPTHVANSAATYANGAFIQANTATNNAAGASLYANGAFIQANAAFSVVNTAVQNTATVVIHGMDVATINVSSLAVIGNTTINNGITINDGGLYQYSTANNSTVTQATSKSTTVTCNGRTGQITTSNASLAKGVGVSFTVNNNQVVSAKDVVIVNLASGGTLNSYQIAIDAVSVGSFSICIVNNGAGALAEALVINFAIIRVN